MKMPTNMLAKWMLAGLLGVTPVPAAQIVFDISLNTSTLPGGNTFALDLQLNDGSGTGNGNNTVMIENLLFGGGSAGAASLTGGASGSASAGFSITDSSFFNDALQVFVPGGFLSFRVTITDIPEPGGTPDAFTAALLQNGVEVPTTSPLLAFLVVNINGPATTITGFPTAAAALPINTGSPLITIIAGPVPDVPEPAAWRLFCAGGSALLLLRRRQRP